MNKMKASSIDFIAIHSGNIAIETNPKRSVAHKKVQFKFVLNSIILPLFVVLARLFFNGFGKAQFYYRKKQQEAIFKFARKRKLIKNFFRRIQNKFLD